VPVIGEREEKMVSLMLCGNAEGKLLKPFFIWDGERPIPSVFGQFKEALHVMSPGGGQTRETFGSWVTNFIEETGGKDYDKPRAIYLDSHYSHISLEALLELRAHNVLVYPYPAHTSHATSPLDVAVFSAAKSDFDHFRTEATAAGGAYGRGMIAACWRKTIAHMCDVDDIAEDCSNLVMPHLQSGFKATGICPHDPSVVFTKHASLIKQADAYAQKHKVAVAGSGAVEDDSDDETGVLTAEEVEEFLSRSLAVVDPLKERATKHGIKAPVGRIYTGDWYLTQQLDKIEAKQALEAEKQARRSRGLPSARRRRPPQLQRQRRAPQSWRRALSGGSSASGWGVRGARRQGSARRRRRQLRLRPSPACAPASVQSSWRPSCAKLGGGCNLCCRLLACKVAKPEVAWSLRGEAVSGD